MIRSIGKMVFQRLLKNGLGTVVISVNILIIS